MSIADGWIDWTHQLAQAFEDAESSRVQRDEVITNAHDIGGLSYSVIANQVGLTRARIITIVKETRAQRAEGENHG